MASDFDNDADNDAARNKAHEKAVVGLAENVAGIAFQCGTCEYFKAGVCLNMHPKLFRHPVQAEWCCNLYDHDGMRVVIS